MLNIGPQELLLIFIVALLVVGPRRLPELGRSIGKGIRELRKAQDEVRKTIQVNLDEPARPGFGKREVAPQADADGADAEPGSRDAAAATATPTASNDVGDISRSLGRGLAELRRTRREIQRSFRVEADRPAPRRRTAKPAASERKAPPADTVSSGDEGAERAGPTDAAHPE
jgi:sec-independent protein translocase protein TatA